MPWLTLGAARLHYTLATGAITSKSAVGEYVAATFPAWADLAHRCVRWRQRRGTERFTPADALAAAGLTDAVVAAARAL